MMNCSPTIAPSQFLFLPIGSFFCMILYIQSLHRTFLHTSLNLLTRHLLVPDDLDSGRAYLIAVPKKMEVDEIIDCTLVVAPGVINRLWEIFWDAFVWYDHQPTLTEHIPSITLDSKQNFVPNLSHTSTSDFLWKLKIWSPDKLTKSCWLTFFQCLLG